MTAHEMTNTLLNQLTICSTCHREPGTWRTPYLEDRAEAERMGYYSCDPCFAAVWAGEN